MDDRYDVIEAGEPGRGRWIGLLILLALLAVPVVSLLASRDPGAIPPVESTSPAATPDSPWTLTTVTPEPNTLHAQSRAKGDDELIDVVFPDGTRAEVRYPAAVQLDGMGSRPFLGGWLAGEMRQVRTLYAPYGGQNEISQGGEPLRDFTPNVTLWPRQAGGQAGELMLFRFGPWRLAMQDRPSGLTFESRMAWAQSLHAKETKDGYLVFSADPPLRLAEPGEEARGEAVGPQLWFGAGGGDMVVLLLTPRCEEDATAPRVLAREGRTPFKVACHAGVKVFAAGEPSFVDLAIEGIEIRLK